MIVASSRKTAPNGTKEYSPRREPGVGASPERGSTVSYRYVSTLGGINSDFSNIFSKLSTIPPQNADQKLRM